MADPVSYGNPERDVEQDETTLIWLSHGEERHLKLASVSRIIPGQRTAVFKRYLCPEKDYLSFSLLYNNGQRSLDLICKNKAETEVWFVGLKALTSVNQRRNSRINGQTDGFYDLKNIAEKEAPDINNLKAMLTDAESLLTAKQINISDSASSLASTPPTEDGMEDPINGADLSVNALEANDDSHNSSDFSSSQKFVDVSCDMPPVSDSKETLHQNTDNDPRSPRSSTSVYNNGGEIIEQFEPGVYVTLVLLCNGVKAFKRVRFSKRRFAEQQAEEWWKQNKDRVFKKYSNKGGDSAPYTHPKTTTDLEEDSAPSSCS